MSVGKKRIQVGEKRKKVHPKMWFEASGGES